MTDQPIGDPTAEQQATGAHAEPDGELAGLDADVRALVERANREAAGYRQQLRESQQATEQALERLQALEREHESDQQRAIREAEERGRQAATGELEPVIAGLRRDVATAAIRTRAADQFIDADDAVQLLPVDELLEEPDEQRRAKLVDKALSELLKAKPHLGRDAQQRQPLVTPGARSDAPNGRPRERSWLRG